ncbi:MAG: non-ribosomal peptide synthetase, partial [Gammaproteobacteria bacterium]|nr:non-ribosomal peptide synthetase [Gammaproteobacteria bacterium]
MRAIERAVATVWAEALQWSEEMGPAADFLVMGGERETMGLAMHRLNESFGTRLSPVALLDFPCLRDFCEFLELAVTVERLRASGGHLARTCLKEALSQSPLAMNHAGRGRRRGLLRQLRELAFSESPKPQRQRSTSIIPLLPWQRSLVREYSSSPDAARHHLGFCLNLFPPLDALALQHATQTLLERHRVLRGRVEYDCNGEPSLTIVDDLPDVFQQAEGRAAEADVRELFAGFLADKFDLTTGPLVRFRLVRTADDGWALILVMHALVADDWTLRLIRGEIESHYTFLLHGWVSRIPEPEFDFADWLSWYREAAEGPAARRRFRWWRAQLCGSEASAPRGNRPTARAAPVSLDTQSERWSLSAAPCRALREACRLHRITMAGLFAAALAVAFASVTGEAEVLVLEVRTARTTVELRKALGQLTDGCLLRVDLSQDPPLNEVLRRVRLLYRNAQLHLPASVHDVLRLPDVDDALADRQIVAFDHLRADWAPALPPGTWPFATRGMEFVYGNLSACMRREVSAHFSVVDSPRSLSWS